ncbi:MAG: 5-oxoprolinase subunit PxpB [Bacteroidota bacterium]
MMRLLPFGDRALVLNFEQRISPAIHQQVSHWLQKIEQANLVGIQYCLPAYCSITIVYDPLLTHFEKLSQAIQNLEAPTSAKENKGISWRIPVCYEADFAPDLDNLNRQTGLSTAEIIRYHTTPIYDIYMMGFLPGFAYMGILPPALYCKRKAQPRLEVPAGAVALAAQQTGIYPSKGPGGWQWIGQTPVSLLLSHSDRPFLFQAGDRVQFHPISKREYKVLAAQIRLPHFDVQALYA